MSIDFPSSAVTSVIVAFLINGVVEQDFNYVNPSNYNIFQAVVPTLVLFMNAGSVFKVTAFFDDDTVTASISDTPVPQITITWLGS